MTLDDMFKNYIHNVVEEYLKTNLDIILREHNGITNTKSIEDLHNVISEYLSDNDYMTRDDVNEQINGAEVRIESIYLSA